MTTSVNKKLSIKDRETLAKGIVQRLIESAAEKRDRFKESQQYKVEVEAEKKARLPKLEALLQSIKDRYEEQAKLSMEISDLHKAIMSTCEHIYVNYNMDSSKEGCIKSLESKIGREILDKHGLNQKLSDQDIKELVIKVDMEILLSTNQDPVYLSKAILEKLKNNGNDN